MYCRLSAVLALLRDVRMFLTVRLGNRAASESGVRSP